MKFLLQIKQISSLSVLTLVLTACSLFGKKEDEKIDYSNQEVAAQEFEKGNILMDSENYQGALDVYSKIIVDKPVSTLDGLILFNAGLSHLLLQQCPAAESKLRKVVRMTHKTTPSLSVRAKLRLSESLSCQGKEKEAMVLLLEIDKEKSLLSAEVGGAEVPAKIAAAYSRNGNRKMAERYFAIAENGVRKLQAQKMAAKDKLSLLGKSLFLMGDATNVKKETLDPQAYFQTLKVQQRYLLRAVEYDVKPWSQKAYDQLLEVYEPTWVFAANITPDPALDETAARRDLKVKRSTIIQMAMDSLRDLKAGKNLGMPETPMRNDLFTNLEKQLAKMNNYLVAEVPGSEFTSEAMKLQAPKREGRVKSGVTELEKKSKQQLPIKKEVKKDK